MHLLSGAIYFGWGLAGGLLVTIQNRAYIWEAHLASELSSACYQSQVKFL